MSKEKFINSSEKNLSSEISFIDLDSTTLPTTPTPVTMNGKVVGYSFPVDHDLRASRGGVAELVEELEGRPADELYPDLSGMFDSSYDDSVRETEDKIFHK